jgi:hypothetical protein
MGNPDTIITSVLPIINAIFIVMVVYITNTNNNIYAALGFLVAGIIIVFVSNLLYQVFICGSIDVKSSAIGTYPTIISVLIGFIVSCIAYARVPVMSAMAPLLSGKRVDVVTGGGDNSGDNSQCCTPVVTLEKLEKDNPDYIKISRGFYLAFAIMFGTIFGKGIAGTCGENSTNTK